MQTLGASLVFREDDGPLQGFTNLHANRDRTDDRSVIRELLQNCLDASADGCCDVCITLSSVPQKEIPFIEQYRSAFKASVEHRGDTEPETGGQAITRIKQSLASETVCCLICVDNGAGIGPEELRSLYGSGVSVKGEGSRGSVGHGHLTAFAPSDLRYVLYAGKRANSETFGGHAILATHKVADALHSADGFIREDTNGRPRAFDKEPGGRTIPETLKKHLSDDSGSVVMIVGYEPIQNSDPAQLILGAAAQHFLVAIHCGNLRLTLTTDEADRSLGRSLIRNGSLREALEGIHQARQKKGPLRSLATMETGEQFVNPGTLNGVRVWMRKKLDDGEQRNPRVSLFRDGMWIVDNLKNFFEPRHFRGRAPFDAVVDLDSTRKGSFGDLARKAEGASHLNVRPNELSDPKQREALRGHLFALQKFLLEQAEETANHLQEYVPPELLLMGGAVNPVQPKKRRTKQPDPTSRERDDAPSPVPGNGSATKNKGGGQGSKRANVRQRVRPGNNAGIRTSCRPDNQRSGRFHVRWQIIEDSRQPMDLGLRLCIPSGTDRTSRDQVRPEYLDIVAARSDGSPLRVEGVEAHVPTAPDSSRSGYAVVDVQGVATADTGLVEAELVRRFRPAENLQDSETDAVPES